MEANKKLKKARHLKGMCNLRVTCLRSVEDEHSPRTDFESLATTDADTRSSLRAGYPPRVATAHLSDPQELNSSLHHLVATTTRTFRPTVNAWRLSQGSPRMLNSPHLPPRYSLLRISFLVWFYVEVKGSGRQGSWDASWGATPLLTLTG